MKSTGIARKKQPNYTFNSKKRDLELYGTGTYLYLGKIVSSRITKKQKIPIPYSPSE